jgi:large repetitive protein
MTGLVRARAWWRILAISLSSVLMMGVLVVVEVGAAVVSAPPASAAAPPIQVSKSGPTSTLEGSPVRYTLSASNPAAGAGGVVQFNVSFRDVLPAGVTYVAGSTLPADAGEPTVVTDPDTGAQTLIWSNAFDLPPGSSDSISFEVVADPAVWPVQSTFTDTATGYSSTEAHVVPGFGPDGSPIADPLVTASAPSSASTQVTALVVSKAEPSPEGKLLRGVHDHTTVYTLTVTNGDGAATDDVVVNDYLPASLEFLGCGGVDNSTTGPEYPGAPSLTATPAVGADCLTPSAVDTVSSPAGLAPGVYTQVTWDVGTLAPGQVLTIQYAAGIPLRQNTLTFPGGAPTPESLGQEANLDNNTGPTTRQNGDGVGLTNTVDVTGTYTGTVESGASPAVDVDVSHTLTANDLRIIKSVSPANFAGGDVATYSLQIDSSEYVNNHAVTVTDTVPNGVCPLDNVENYVTGAPGDCAPGPQFAPSVGYRSVTQNSDGTFTVVFDPIAVPQNGSTTITFEARMRTTYTGGALAGEPTATGDTFTNNVSMTGLSTPIAGTGETGLATVTDTSSVTQQTAGGTFSKEIQPRVTNQDCSADTYASSSSLTPAQTTFQKGDRICFEITVEFPPDNPTLNPVISDFLPVNSDYEAGSATVTSATKPAYQISFDESGAADGELQWTLGNPLPDGDRDVPAGAVFQVRFSVTVTGAASPGGPALGSANLAKATATNSSGQVVAFRSDATFSVDPAPPVAITKGVQSVNSLPAGGNPPNVDHVQVQEGDVVVFRVDVSNPGGSPSAVQSVQTWDALPPGIRCADVSAISAGGVCTDPGKPGQPSFAQAGTLSAIVWARPASEVIDPGTSVTYTYAVTIPAGTAAGTDLVDTASVRSFDAQTNVPGRVVTYFPQSNVDTTVPVADQDAPAASDSSDVFLATVAVAKNVSSAINEPGNMGGETPPGGPSTQATIGEDVTYTIFADVPAHTTVYDGVLTDPLPTGLTLLSASAGFSPDAGTTPPTSPLPPGASFDAATATLTLPAVFDNTSGTAVRFAVTITARVTTAGSNVAGVTLINTATFTPGAPPAGSTPSPQTASSDVAIVEPAPSLTKSANPVHVTGGQTVTYTLTAGNGGSASVLHDAWVVDCLPAGLTFDAYGTPTQGTTVTASSGGGAPCPAGTTQLEWNVGDIDPGASAALTYTATVTPAATGLETFTNNATLTGDSLAGTRTGPTDPGNSVGRLYTKTTSRTIEVLGADLTKTVSPTAATIGQTVTYTVVGALAPNVSYFNLTGVDNVPAGLDPASLQLVSQSCVNLDGTTCPLTPGTILPPVANGTGAIVGIFFGNVAGASQPRIITIEYSARVADVAQAVAGATLTNAAHLGWDNTAKPPPANAGATFDQSSTTASAPLTVIEPSMSITKSVDHTTVEPGQTFHYTIDATNSSAATASAAYNAVVTDTVPGGVVVTPASITNGGTLTEADPTTGAGGTITWDLPGPIDPGATVTLGYDATLAPSAGLTTAAQTNQAVVSGYDSLPSGGRHYPATNPATATVTPVFPSVQATKSTPQGTTAYIGESFTWQITLRNSGAGTAYNVGAIDVLPPNWTYDNNSAEVSINGGPANQVDPAIDFRTGRLFWIDLADLAPGGSLTITYTATPGPDVATLPGVGLSVDQTNSALPRAQDATGATGNQTGAYAGPAASAVAHIASADVVLTKQVGTQPTAGQSGSWIVTVANHGPDAATGPFTVTDGFNDPLPVGVSDVTASGNGWSCSSAAPLTCVRTNPADTLANGASFPPITVSYDVASDVTDGTVLANSATVTARTFDPDLDNNTGEADTTVNTKADLAITKTLTSPQMVAGDPATYAVAVTNLGPSVSAGPFVVTDTLPPTSTFVSASGTGWLCEPLTAGTVGATLTCTHPASLAVGEVTAELVITVGIPSAQTGPVTNTATITNTTTPDPNLTNNTASVTDIPAISADLAIQKEHVGTFVAGADAQYTLEVVNNGPSDAANATITDPLPAEVTFVSGTGTGWTCSAAGQAVTCSHPTPYVLGEDTTVTLDVHLASDLAAPVNLENTATVSSTTPDPDLTNNTDSDNTTINDLADLAITKHHTGNATAGEPFQYTLSVTNNGPSDIPGPVTVTDPLPQGITYVSATGTGWTCTNPSGSPPNPRLVTCILAGGLTANSAAPDITLDVTVDPNAVPSTIVNTASVRSDIGDPDLANNIAVDPTQVKTVADVALTKTVDTPTPVLAGTDVTFTLQASNSGPSDAANVTIDDPLPDHLEYVSATGDGWTCNLAGTDVVCERPTVPAVPPGSAVPPVTLVTQVDPAIPVDADFTATIVNTATASSSTFDPNLANNTAEATVPVIAEADLTLTKTPSTGTPVAGTSFTWTFVAHNNGPSVAASPLTLTDDLPPGESFLSAAAPWTCGAGPPPTTSTGQQSVTCTLPSTLDVGTDAPALEMLVQLSAAAPSGSQTNTAEVTSPTPGDPGTGTGTITVARSAEFTITKTHSGSGVVGKTVDFHLVVSNRGPSDADQIVVTDPLPSGLTYVSAKGTDWSCTSAKNDVTCHLAGTLPAGTAAAPINLTVRVGPAAYEHVVNVATVSSTDPDLPGQASASDRLNVDPDANLTLTKRHTGQFTVGEQGTYLLTVSNSGPTAAPGPIKIHDPLPTGLTYVSASGDGWTCSESNNAVTCIHAAPLPAGASSSVTLTVNVEAAAAPSVVNTATASDPGSPDTSASDTAPVTTPPTATTTTTTTTTAQPADASPADNSDLATTGFDVLLGLAVGLGVALLGALTVIATRRRRRAGGN